MSDTNEKAVAVLQNALEQAVNRAGALRMQVMTESPEQVARDLLDALNLAGLDVVEGSPRQ